MGPGRIRQTAEASFVIEYALGEPFNTSGNGIGGILKARSHHHLSAPAVFKEHLAAVSSGREQNDTGLLLQLFFV